MRSIHSLGRILLDLDVHPSPTPQSSSSLKRLREGSLEGLPGATRTLPRHRALRNRLPDEPAQLSRHFQVDHAVYRARPEHFCGVRSAEGDGLVSSGNHRCADSPSTAAPDASADTLQDWCFPAWKCGSREVQDAGRARTEGFACRVCVSRLVVGVAMFDFYAICFYGSRSSCRNAMFCSG